MWLEDIKEKQEIELAKQELNLAMKLECEFIKSLAYFKHCGVHLDVVKWRNKMAKDLVKLKDAEQELNDRVVQWDSERDMSMMDGILNTQNWNFIILWK